MTPADVMYDSRDHLDVVEAVCAALGAGMLSQQQAGQIQMSGSGIPWTRGSFPPC